MTDARSISEGYLNAVMASAQGSGAVTVSNGLSRRDPARRPFTGSRSVEGISR